VGESEGRTRITRRVGFTGLDRESTPPGTARSCTGRLSSFHGTMHTGALCAVCRLVTPPPRSLEINIALCSCTSRSCVAPMDRFAPARRLGCTECSSSYRKIYRGLSQLSLFCGCTVHNNYTRTMDQRWVNATNVSGIAILIPNKRFRILNLKNFNLNLSSRDEFTGREIGIQNSARP